VKGRTDHDPTFEEKNEENEEQSSFTSPDSSEDFQFYNVTQQHSYVCFGESCAGEREREREREREKLLYDTYGLVSDT